ncbi:tyrosine-type recombinase/integrase [Sediminitomix flava]|uniref:Site-specific recombinase XerD n=1 Tax=Sediminitomix flava TaxID=379075 RepID=A0A315Z590_SEDFL|nr:tyrosine-type recombinase/integrase [Sediminitomix flava]PWJ38643.1 site-specific recombinase XerD [Sediminitomix flava]
MNLTPISIRGHQGITQRVLPKSIPINHLIEMYINELDRSLYTVEEAIERFGDTHHARARGRTTFLAKKSLHGFFTFIQESYGGMLYDIPAQMKSFREHINTQYKDGKLTFHQKAHLLCRINNDKQFTQFQKQECRTLSQFLSEEEVTNISEHHTSTDEQIDKLLKGLEEVPLIKEYLNYVLRQGRLKKATGTPSTKMIFLRKFLRYVFLNKIAAQDIDDCDWNASVYTKENVDSFIYYVSQGRLDKRGKIQTEGNPIRSVGVNNYILALKNFFAFLLEKELNPTRKREFINKAIQLLREKECQVYSNGTLSITDGHDIKQTRSDLEIYMDADATYQEHISKLTKLSQYALHPVDKVPARCYLPKYICDEIIECFNKALKANEDRAGANHKKTQRFAGLIRLKYSIILAIEAGLRVSTIGHIHVEDYTINKDGTGVLQLRFCKGYEPFEAPSLPLSKEAVDALESAREAQEIGSGPIFKKNMKSSFLRFFREWHPTQGKYTDSKGKLHQISMHYFRYTFGANMLDKTKNLSLVSKLLSHRDTAITEKIYLRDKLNEELMSVYTKTDDNT